MRAIRGAVACLALVIGLCGDAKGSSIFFVADARSDTNIPAVLEGDGHSVVSVLDDYAAGSSALQQDLSAYPVVYWSATVTGNGNGVHPEAVYANIEAYVASGGRVFVTGYDSIASSKKPGLISLLGGTDSRDCPGAPGAVIDEATSLTVGVVDIRGITPAGGYGDRDELRGLTGSGALGVVPTAGGDGWQWALRSLGAGEIAYVSNGQSGANAHVSWEDTSAGGAGAYNAALRNFAVPEPASVLLLTLGAVPALARRRKR